jgi:hypothetical protein
MSQFSLWTPDGHEVRVGTHWRHSSWDLATPSAVVGEILFEQQYIRWHRRGGSQLARIAVRQLREGLGWIRSLAPGLLPTHKSLICNF